MIPMPMSRMHPMTCDDAFDALTDPLLRDDAALRSHLEGCPRCRQMEEVLQPALAALAPLSSAGGSFSVSEEPSAPFLTPDLIAEAEAAARALTPRPAVASQGGSNRRAFDWRMTTLSLVFVFCVSALPFVAAAWNTHVTPAAACLWKQRPGTEIAAAGTTDPAETASQRVVLTCVACHLPTGAVRP
jgi:hypothetical protein